MSRSSLDTSSKHIVIIGAGIIGCTTAYFLTRHPSFDASKHRVTVLEATSIAAGASGKAGGLLAKWAYPDPLVGLSYRLHSDLAAEYGGDQRWGYRTVGCGSIEAVGRDPEELKRTAQEMKAAAESLEKQELPHAAGSQTTEARFAPIGEPREAEVRPSSHVAQQERSSPVGKHQVASGCIVVAPPNNSESFCGDSKGQPGGFKVAEALVERPKKRRRVGVCHSQTPTNLTPSESGPRGRIVVAPPVQPRRENLDLHQSQGTDKPAEERPHLKPRMDEMNSQQMPRPSGPSPEEALCEQILANLKKLTRLQENSKEWEKLPKKDSTAASLLLPNSPLPKDLDWFDGRCVESWSVMGVPGTSTETAQVHPFHFTTSIAKLSQEAGAQIIEGAQVIEIEHNPNFPAPEVTYRKRSGPHPNGQHEGLVRIKDATEVVICAGPWTSILLPKSSISAPRAHSVVFDVNVSPYAVFSELKLPRGFVPDHRRKSGQQRIHKDTVDPEVYARPFSEVYACGETDSTVPLPETADRVEANIQACDDITAYLSTVSPTLGSAPVKAKQACYLPVHKRFGKERGPLIGKTTTPGLFVASGHTCWGIQNGPGTGKLLSELLMDGKTTSASIDEFDPRKFKVGLGSGGNGR